MTPPRDGQVVTFYSYKGGTGRTMALANVAVDPRRERQAGARRRLGPGVPRPAPVLRARSSTTAMVASTRRRDRPDPGVRVGAPRRAGRRRLARRLAPRSTPGSSKYAVLARLGRSPAAARWTSCSAGRQNPDYATSVTGLNWDNFYDRLGGGAVLRRAARGHEAPLRLHPDRQPHRPQRRRRHLHHPPARHAGRLLHPQRPGHRRRRRGRPGARLRAVPRAAHPGAAGADAGRRRARRRRPTPAGRWPCSGSPGCPAA